MDGQAVKVAPVQQKKEEKSNEKEVISTNGNGRIITQPCRMQGIRLGFLQCIPAGRQFQCNSAVNGTECQNG